MGLDAGVIGEMWYEKCDWEKLGKMGIDVGLISG